MPELSIEDINKAVKDSAYAAVGFGVLGFQRAQVRRRELIEQLQGSGTVGPHFETARDQLNQLAKLVEDQLDPAREQLASYVKVLEDQVGPAREQVTSVAKKVDEQVAPVRKQVEGSLDEIEQRLPASTRNAFATIRSGAHSTEGYLRGVVGLEHSAS